MAWYGLALLRAGEFSGVSYRPAVAVLGRVLREEWDAAPAGGIPWRSGDTFRNAPANGPAAVLLARLGDPARAGAISDWIEANLLDSASGLIRDGVRDGAVVPDRAAIPGTTPPKGLPTFGKDGSILPPARRKP